MTPPIPEDCPVASAASQTQSFRIPTKFGLSEFLKILGFIGVLVAAWFRMEQGLAEIRQEQKFDKERMTKIEEGATSSASELQKRLDKIDDKLDRLIERRGER